MRSGNRRKNAGDLSKNLFSNLFKFKPLKLLFPKSVPFETDNNIGTIDVDANGALHPWYGDSIAKQDTNDTMPVATPNPTADMDHPTSDESIIDDPSFKMPHGSFYPQIFYDDHHNHFDHDIPMTTTTTPAPPPKTKPMYAHYSLRLKFWYAHLAFAFWFIMYMIWLMMKSVGRHKVRILLD